MKTTNTIPVGQLGSLIEKHGGNLSVIARHLGFSRTAIRNRINRSAELKQKLEENRETMLDEAESVLYRKALEGSTVELLFFLKTQGKSRGYTERQEISGPDGDAITVDIGDTLASRIDRLAARIGTPETDS